MIAFILEQMHSPDWGAIGITVAVAVCSVLLVCQMLTGELGEDEEQRHPDFQSGFGEQP